MARWITGFLPNINGNYLIRCKYMDRIIRVDFVDGKWIHPKWGEVFSNAPYIEWWDEYEITEIKKVIKVNLKI